MHKLEEAQDNNFVTCQKPKEDRLDLLHMNLHSGEFLPLHSETFGLFRYVPITVSIFVVNLAPYLIFFLCESWQSKNRPSILCRYVLPTSVAAIANSWHALANSSQKKSDFSSKK